MGGKTGLNGAYAVLLVAAAVLTGCAALHTASLQPRPEHWAPPLSIEGLPQAYKVTDELYRGARPTAEGVRELSVIGVKTIVNLESFHSDRDEIGQIGIQYERIPMKPWHPEEEDVVQFLEIVTDNERTPVFVHCAKGADRTGMMCAIYRVAVSGWTKEEAIEEMTKGGYGHHRTWSNLVRFIEELDIAEVRSRAGIGGTCHDAPESRPVEGH